MSKKNKLSNFPTILVVFGATGDLMTKKIVPSLFLLYKKNKLPKLFNVVGFSHRNWTNEKFKSHIESILKKHKLSANAAAKKKFLELFTFKQGEFTKKRDYENLDKVLGRVDGEWKLCANKLFYLAVQPKYVKTIAKYLDQSELTKPCSPEEGWTRVIVEKPFGHNYKSARDLDILLGEIFKEEQIYRIDHYLAKELLQNILSFRFSNNLLNEQSWNSQHIERMDLSLLEDIGVEDRGEFYDSVGALRDVGENHLLQMLALVTLEAPLSITPEEIRKARASLLTKLKKPLKRQILQTSLRGQYSGFRKIKGVKKKSTTETYFKLAGEIDSARWQGMPFTIEGGKRMGRKLKQIVVTFRHPHPCLCPTGAIHNKDKIIFSMEPEEGIKIKFWSKKPGLGFKMEERNFNFILRSKQERQRYQYIEEYTKLLLDCINGDQTLFVSTKEINTTWKFIDGFTEVWKKNPSKLKFYQDNTDLITKLDFDSVKSKPEPINELGVVGLGKMGGNLARHLLNHNWRIVGYNRSKDETIKLKEDGLEPAFSLKELVNKLGKRRVIWLMVPAGAAVDKVLFGKAGLSTLLNKGDIIIDGGNSFYKNTIKRGQLLSKKGIKFIDAGVSGGPAGAFSGACVMVGGKKSTFKELENLFKVISVPNGYQFFPGLGAGHFVKMVHNGIEYGIMQAIAEGFAIMKKSKFKLNLSNVANIYNHGSVIESRLIEWLEKAFELKGENLKNISGKVHHSGEGMWTVKTAKLLKVKAKIIEAALKFRIDSQKNPSYTGQVVSALRGQFGGHSVKK